MLTGAQLSVLAYAEQRALGMPWTADQTATEQCRELGLLEAGTIDGMEPGAPNSTGYSLTQAGREALAGRGLT